MSARILILLFAAVVVPLCPANADQVTPSPKIECARPLPQPIVRKAIFPKTRFQLEKIDNSVRVIATGTETVQFSNGDRLTITNEGCEFITLRFRFETSRFNRQRIADPKYLYRRSAWLMRQTLRGLKSPFNLAKGITALEKYAGQNPQPDLDKEIEYGNSEIRSVVRLAKVQPLSNRKTAVEMVFYYGPI
jgi:hypothetical protein